MSRGLPAPTGKASAWSTFHRPPARLSAGRQWFNARMEASATSCGSTRHLPPRMAERSGGIDLEQVYCRDAETKSSRVEALYAELRDRSVHYGRSRDRRRPQAPP